MIAIAAVCAALAPATAWAEQLDPPELLEHAAQMEAEVQQEAVGAAVSAEEFQWLGVVYDGYGQRFTWYSENVLPGDGLYELNANGRHVDGDGYVVDGDGYIAVASPDWDMPIGTVVETPFGVGRVYDYCGTDAYDIYCAW